MLKNNSYNIDKEFDYATIKAIVSKSLENMTKEEEALKKKPNVPNDIIFDHGNFDDNPNNFSHAA